MQVENEVKVAEAQAKKLIVAAEAEKKANELRQQALTPEILEKMWIEKWNGALPVYCALFHILIRGKLGWT